ncbi:MAG: rRNA maturation RNase YbeY [Holosporaceae bacterium]|nr:rRNA maturation RNase YbeY [Holosporaceae bacterium]
MECNSWNEREVKTLMADCARAVFDELVLKTDNVEICFLFSDDKEIRTLNKTYLGVDKSTNVLSFPADDLTTAPSNDGRPCILGSIALAFETVEKEAQRQNKSFYDHLKHLIVHSLLHLLRYDHSSEQQAEQMESLEVKILQKLGIGNPYL